MKKTTSLILFLLVFFGLVKVVERANAQEINQARLNRVDACTQAYIETKAVEYYKVHDQNIITRCATYATLVYAYESGYGKSSKCTSTKNCYGIKQGGRFVWYDTYKEGDLDFARYYMKWHLNKNAYTFIRGYYMDGRWQYGWSQTDVYTYIDFISKNYWDVYNEIEPYSNVYNNK